MKHQQEAISKIMPNKVGALFMKMGTGKSKVAVELVNSVSVDLVLWVGPLRSIEPLAGVSIIEEINKWGGFKSKAIFVGIESIGQSDRVYIETLNSLKEAKSSFIVVDESIKIKNISAKRTKRLLEFSKLAEYKLILNGQPLTRDLLDLWAQFQFLDARILNMDISEFKNTFCKYTSIVMQKGLKYYKKEFITGYENIDYLYSLIGEWIYECDLDLEVKQIFEVGRYSLSGGERDKYNHLKEKYLNKEMLIAMNNNIFLEMTQKMQHQYCLSEEKFKVIDTWIEDESRTIIFCKYIASAKACMTRYPKAMVLNYKTGALSLNLQSRPHTVYFDQTWDWGDVVQSEHRNYRIGQEEDCRYLKLVGDVGLEKLIYKNNQKKVGMAEYFNSINKNKLKSLL